MISKPSIFDPAKKLRNAYLIALTLLGLLVIFGQYFIKQFLEDQKSDGRVINIAGRQRMLSQRLTKCLLILSISTDSVEIKKRHKELKEVFMLWKKSHIALQKGDSLLQIPANFNSDSVKTAFQKISQNHEIMLESARKIIENFGKTNFKEIIAQELTHILENEGIFLKGMNQIVEIYDQESGQKVLFLEKIQIVLTITTILILFLEGMFIFRPNVKNLSNYIKVLEQNDALKAAEEELKQNLEEIKQINEKMIFSKIQLDKVYKNLMSSINYAKRIQDAILPLSVNIEEGLGEHFIIFRPKDVVSGDFYWFASLDNQCMISVIDCTGHGIPGAFMSLIANDLLNQIIFLKKITDPEQILTQLDTYLSLVFKQENMFNHNSMDLAFVVITDKALVEISAAKSSVFYIQNNELQQIKGSPFPIGGEGMKTRTNKNFTKHQIFVGEGTTFYMFSDGFQDQFGGKYGKKFMKQNFRKLFTQIHTQSMEEQKLFLENSLDFWKQDYAQTDDITVLGFRI